MSKDIGVFCKANDRDFLANILNFIGLKGKFAFVDCLENSQRYQALIINYCDALIKQRSLLSKIENQRVLLFLDQAIELPWDIQLTKTSCVNALVLRPEGEEVTASLAGLKIPGWNVAAVTLKPKNDLHLIVVARSYPKADPLIIAFQDKNMRVVLCGIPLFHAIQRCASSVRPFGYGALVSLFQKMIQWLYAYNGCFRLKYRYPVAVFSFDMEEPIINRTVGKVLLKFKMPWRPGKYVIVSTQKSYRILPLKKRVFVSRNISQSLVNKSSLFRLYIDWHSNRSQCLFQPRSLPMLQIEVSEGKKFIKDLLLNFEKSLMEIADTFESYNGRCTFFVPAIIIQYLHNHSLLQGLQNAGFEFALHSYCHDHYGIMSLSKIRDDLKRSIEVFHQAGLTPLGNRSPGLLMNEQQYSELAKLGLLYDSSMLEVYKDYPVIPVRIRTLRQSFYQVPISANLYNPNTNITSLITRIAKSQGMLHVYGHDHEFDSQDSNAEHLENVLRTLKENRVEIMSISDVLRSWEEN